MDENKVGTITHYFDKIGVGIILLNTTLAVGSTVKFKGGTTDFDQTIAEMQHDHKNIESGEAGQEVGVKVDEVVREGDSVLLVG